MFQATNSKHAPPAPPAAHVQRQRRRHQHDEQQQRGCVHHARPRALVAPAFDVGHRARNRARGGHAAKKRHDQCWQCALGHQLLVGVVFFVVRVGGHAGRPRGRTAATRWRPACAIVRVGVTSKSLHRLPTEKSGQCKHRQALRRNAAKPRADGLYRKTQPPGQQAQLPPVATIMATMAARANRWSPCAPPSAGSPLPSPWAGTTGARATMQRQRQPRTSPSAERVQGCEAANMLRSACCSLREKISPACALIAQAQQSPSPATAQSAPQCHW